MAPDKIYVMPSTFMELGYIDVVCKNKKGIEYIRKDALLDKLNLALELRGDGNPNSDGVQTIKAMINYIESL